MPVWYSPVDETDIHVVYPVTKQFIHKLLTDLNLREVVQGVDQVRLQKTVNLIRLQAEATAIILAVFQKAQNLLLTFLIQKIL